jgi:glucose-6-phosphate dehydrogenase assembly protein OpcA
MEQVSSDKARGIDLAGLEKRLAAMWREAAGADDAGQSGVTRVCVSNLIVQVPADSDRDALRELLDSVAEQTPSRVILLCARREAEDKLEAFVSSRCRVALKGRRQVCGEQVTIEAGGARVETAASAVEPLLVPDIPAFLWWKDIPQADDKLFRRLVEMVDRVVIDSAAFDHPHADLRHVARLVETRSDVLRISDLNWGRLTAWRNLIAGFWDVPDYRAHLDAADSVVVEYAPAAESGEEVAAQALLVAGWLASRLGWRLVNGSAREGKSHHFNFASGTRTISLELRATDGRAGCLRRVCFDGADGAAKFYARMDKACARLETSAQVGDALRVGRILAYEAKTEGQRLSRELSILARDEVYEQAVLSAVQLIAQVA